MIGGLIVTGLSNPLGPALTDLGQLLNPFAGTANELKVVALGPDTDITDGYIVPDKTFDDVTPLPGPDSTDGYLYASPAEWKQWKNRVGAVSAGRHLLKLSLQGGSSKAVTIHGMDVTADCHDPVPGVHLVYPGAGGLPSRHFRIILDEPGGPTVTPYGKTGEERPDPEPAQFPFYVSESELEYFVLDVQVRSRSCTWRATLHWNVDGRQGTTEIGDDSTAFRVTAPTAATSRHHLNGTRL
ncbi:hypothetical protein GCM10010145_47130 [Streptomyces ruber]|uniref:Uncharacterized protein n=2 Tax=Streptomyces TaxID=1883 RepID=A0A918BIR9_9ACTN|nr:hypothetical protein GCM10010145_47130 [Streptomyces ruber]